MKTIHYIAASLLLITGLLHVIPLIKSPGDPESMKVFFFGVVYFTIGVLFFLKKKIAALLGIIFPLVGLGVGFFVMGINNWDTLFSILFAIDFVVIILCVIIILKRK